MNLLRVWLLTFPLLTAFAQSQVSAEDTVILPPGVRAVWDLAQADRESSSTRERVCLNGLWRWQPARATAETLPSGGWGYFKVPGSWPGITDYMEKDCQVVYAHPTWSGQSLAAVRAAWYQREFTVPDSWSGRRIVLQLEYLNSLAEVWVDGNKAGQIRFPGGELDVTAKCHSGEKHRLSLLVLALPLRGVMLSYSDTFGARKVPGTVERRGLCGDVFLTGEPAGARLADVHVSTSVRRGEITFAARVPDAAPDRVYTLKADVLENGRKVKEFTSASRTDRELTAGNVSWTEVWKPEKLWDTITPQNMLEVRVSLMDEAGQVVDTALPVQFGYREFWIDGRDFYLNGTRIFLCAVPLDNAQVGAAWATYAAARESLERLKSFGINFVYTHNYGCEPGTHLSFEEILRAADDEGMLVSFSQPHFGQYSWEGADADRTNGYAHDAAYYVRAARNHPSVVFYSMSHNATGTEEEMNPEMIDGVHDQRNRWSENNAGKALRAEAIVHGLDPTRIVYHHSSGNLGAMHTANFYANFAPIQEMSDWFEHWATTGVKPVFLCEYGVPIFWDWMMYRGWYQGTRTFGSAQVPWEFCLAEWDAQFLGPKAYQLTDLEKQCLRWEAEQFRAGRVWHRWDYPHNGAESNSYDDRNAVLASYLTENLRAFRTWGLSAFCPWDHGVYWRLRSGANRERREVPTDWEHLQRPGFSPDFIADQMDWMNISYDRSDWIPTVAGQALIRNNQPLLAYLGGKPGAFTSRAHNFLPGESLEKQLIVINNSRRTVEAKCDWTLALPEPRSGQASLTIETGRQARQLIAVSLPHGLKPGPYKLHATVRFSTGETQEDELAIAVLPSPKRLARPGPSVALFDPKGETTRLLHEAGWPFTTVAADVDLAPYDVLIVGKGALDLPHLAPDISRVRDGLKVVVFEQTPEVLEQRFGFRVAAYGLRRVFARVPDHPILDGLSEADLKDWQGESTLLPPRLSYKLGPRYAPEVTWCGLPVTRLWRAGNRGTVASALIEKPARGDFKPILDGGYSLQFSPLLEDHEGRGLILFCQLDVTGRTEPDPAGQLLVRNLLQYVAVWTPSPARSILHAGDEAGRKHLERAGFNPRTYAGTPLGPSQLLAVGPGASPDQLPPKDVIAKFLQEGGALVSIGVDEAEANAFLPNPVRMARGEHISAYFPSFPANSSWAGISPADVHNRDPRQIPLAGAGAGAIGDGVLGQIPGMRVFFCQMAPWTFQGETENLRRTYRKASLLLTRLLCNLGGESSTRLLENFHRPLTPATPEQRWLQSYYLDTPVEWDDPYRFFCW